MLRRCVRVPAALSSIAELDSTLIVAASAPASVVRVLPRSTLPRSPAAVMHVRVVARSSGQYMHAGRREAITLTLTYEAKPGYDLDHSETGLPEDPDTSHPLHGDAPAPPDSPTFAELGVKKA